MTTLTSRNGTLKFGPGLPTVLINNQLKIVGQSPEVLEQLKNGKIDKMFEIAREGQRVGTHMVDIVLDHFQLEEAVLLPKVAATVHEEIGCPISLDTRDPIALDAALTALQPHKCLVNSVSAEQDYIETLLPIASKHNAAVVAMPISDKHVIPHDVDGRIEVAKVLIQACEAVGIPKDDIVVDGICMSTSASPNSMQVTLETIKILAIDMGLTTFLEIVNAGHGMPPWSTPSWRLIS